MSYEHAIPEPEVLPTAPAVARWELSLRLGQRAEDLAISVKAITSTLGFSRNYWSAVIHDRAVLTEDKLTLACELLDFDADERAELFKLRAIAKERSWLSRYSAAIPSEDVIRFYGLEAGAERIQAWESMLVNGLLQTEAYARALIGTDPNVTASRATQLVQLRLQRQQRLWDDDHPLELQVVMSEAALWQQTGGIAVLHEQLRFLLRIGEERPNVEMRIVPFTAPTLTSLGGATRFLFHFASGRLPILAWAEHSASIEHVQEGAERFEQMRIAHGRALDMSLSREESLTLIKDRADHIG